MTGPPGPPVSGPPATSRSEQKQRTRRAILDASLALSAESTLAALSLRAVAKEVGVVPTAFYRHFGSVDDVGLALVDECFASLNVLLRELRAGAPGYADIIDFSIRVLVEHVTTHRELYRFLVRERVAGPPRVRSAIRHDLALTTRDLAADLARLTGTEGFSTDDLRLLADLIVSFVVTTAERLVSEPDAATRIAAEAGVQLRMLVVGAANWRSR